MKVPVVVMFFHWISTMPSSIILLAATSGSSKETQTYYVKHEEFRINRLDAGYSLAK